MCALAVAGLLGCGGAREPGPSPAQQPDSLLIAIAAVSAPARQDLWRDLSASAQQALDSANVLFRTKHYPEALGFYRLTASRSPGDPTALFGIYMVAQATKNVRLGDSAMAVLRSMGMGDQLPAHPTTR